MLFRRWQYIPLFGVILLLLALWISCSVHRPRVLSVRNLEQQIMAQLRDSDISSSPRSVRILEVQPMNGGFAMTIELNWGRNKISNTAINFAPISARYAMGTLNVPEVRPAVPLLLHFPD